MLRLFIATFTVTFAAPLTAQTACPVPALELTDEVAAADAALFSAFVDRCDVNALETLVKEDFEMFHDKVGA
jgi:hypothetical protein